MVSITTPIPVQTVTPWWRVTHKLLSKTPQPQELGLLVQNPHDPCPNVLFLVARQSNKGQEEISLVPLTLRTLQLRALPPPLVDTNSDLHPQAGLPARAHDPIWVRVRTIQGVKKWQYTPPRQMSPARLPIIVVGESDMEVIVAQGPLERATQSQLLPVSTRSLPFR